jgi:excisionase family DNA binding protein
MTKGDTPCPVSNASQQRFSDQHRRKSVSPNKTVDRRPADSTPDNPSGVLLTIEQAAERLNMSPRYVRRLVAERRIAFHKMGRAVRLHITDVNAFIDAGRVEPITATSVWTQTRSVA